MELKFVTNSFFKQLFQNLRPKVQHSKNRFFVTSHFGTLFSHRNCSFEIILQVTLNRCILPQIKRNEMKPTVMHVGNLQSNILVLQVLIPVFALGRAQELCILLETFWYVSQVPKRLMLKFVEI